jgi:formylglycine-generating enzyme required for sulfatase activity
MEDLMIALPGGDIQMRDDRLEREWNVALEPFLMARYPVTQDVYFDVARSNPSSFRGKRKPVETVSWREAIFFCNKLSLREGLDAYYLIGDTSVEVSLNAHATGYRLPTEAEWEYACKAGTRGIRYGELDQIAWYKNNSRGSTRPVGEKQPNPWGLYDMLGNVWEWCSDIYDETVYGSYRVLRGGGWNDEARGCLATNRRRSHPISFRIDDLGFRIARNSPF